MVLITGASGFLGQHLLQQLSGSKVTIRALYNNNSPNDHLLQLPNVGWMQCNLLDIFETAQAMEGITQVYHCAGKVSFDTKDKKDIEYINAESTANVVNAAIEANVQKLIHVSSIATLGRSNTDFALDENTFWEESKNNTAYARSKYLAEMEVWRGIAEGLNATIVNPSIILGAGNWNEGSARLMQIADKEFPFFTEGVNGWVAAKDVARAMILLMQSEINAERFILNEGNHAYKEIFTLMANALGKKPPHIKAPEWATGLLWRFNAIRNFFTGKTATVTKETTRTAQIQCRYNNQKFLDAFSDFSYTPIQETIREMAIAYQKK